MRSSPRECVGRPSASRSSPTTGWRRSSPIRPGLKTPRPPTRSSWPWAFRRERIFLAGDSGGGGLANSLLLERPEHVEPVQPAGLVLFSPEVDLRLDEPSVTENADRDILPWNIPTAAYLHGTDASSAPVAPLRADLGA